MSTKRLLCHPVAVLTVALMFAAGCSNSANSEESVTTTPVSASPATEAPSSTVAPTTTTAAPSTTAPPTTNQPATTTTTLPSPFAPPEWLGTRIMTEEEKQNSFRLVETPPELVDRRIETRDLLDRPDSTEFTSSIGPVPEDVVARSTWRTQCPVTLAQLSYLTVSHVGFEGEIHTGELIVNARYAEDVVSVFAKLFAARFPMEQLRVIDLPELDEEPAGDWNDTTGFTCRDATGNGRWSEHAFGNAIDINPFHNPYLKGDRVIPERAAAYADRTRDLPGMVTPNSEAGQLVIDAFADIGWGWGGNWNSLKDWMHFSASGG